MVNHENPKSYDKLECPVCDKLCNPVKVKKNGTVVYENHECDNSDDFHFEIDVNGDLVE